MNESNPPSPSEEKEISLVTGLPVSKTWYALEPKTNRVLDEDSDLKVLHERVKEKGLEVVYSRHQFEIRAKEESPSPSEEWENQIVRDLAQSTNLDYKGRVNLESKVHYILREQRERIVREIREWVKENEYCSKCCSSSKFCQEWGQHASALDTENLITLLSKLSPGSKE